MPKVTNAFTTYNAVGNREDLSNVIYNIDPFDTPVMSAIRRRNVKNRLFDWQTEFLPNVSPTVVPGTGAMDPATNAQFEGFALAPSAGPADDPPEQRDPDFQARRDDLWLAGGIRRRGQGLRDEPSDGDGFEGSEVRHGNRDLQPPAAHRRQRHRTHGARHRGHHPLARPGEGQDRSRGWRHRAGNHHHWTADAVDGPVSGPSCACSADRGDGRRRDAESLHEWCLADIDGSSARAEAYSQYICGSKSRRKFSSARPRSCQQ